MRRKWFARAQFAGRNNQSPRRMIHYHERGFIEIKNLSQLFGDTNLISAVSGWKLAFIAQAEDFFRIRVDVTALTDRQTERRSAEDISDKLEATAVPGEQVGTGTGG